MKRSNGEGSAWYNEKRSRYEFSITYLEPSTNKSKRKVFTSKASMAKAKKKAKEFLEILKNTSGLGKDAASKLKAGQYPTVKEWLEEWLSIYKKAELRPKTIERYEGLCSQNIYPFIGDKKINEIEISHAQDYLNTLRSSGGAQKQGLAARSVNATRRLLIDAFNDYIRVNNASFANKFTLTKAMKVEKTEMHIISVEEAQSVVAVALKHGRYQWLIMKIALSMGLRAGEIFGLRFSRINLEKKRLTIDTTVVTTKNGILIQYYVKKNASFRTIPIPDSLIAAFRRYILWLKVRSIRLGIDLMQYDWLFPNDKGRPRSPNSFSAHDFKDIIVEAGINRSFRLHDCRHSVATWLCASDEHLSLKEIGGFLGHSSMRSTEVYLHLVESMKETTLVALNKLF